MKPSLVVHECQVYWKQALTLLELFWIQCDGFFPWSQPLDKLLETTFSETRCSLVGRLVKLSSVLSSDLDDVESSRGPSCWAKTLSAALALFKNLWEKTKLTSPPSNSRKSTVHVLSFLLFNRKTLVCRHENISVNIQYFKCIQLYETKTTLEQRQMSPALL